MTSDPDPLRPAGRSIEPPPSVPRDLAAYVAGVVIAAAAVVAIVAVA